MAKNVIPVDAPGAETDETPSNLPALVPVIAEKPAFIDLIKFSAKEDSLKTIKETRAEYDKVVISGVDDTANYKLVVANMSQMRDDRRAFENAAYDNVIDPLKAALKDYVADIDAVVEEFKAGEKAERDKKDFIDNEKKRIKKEKEEAQERAALLRIDDLNKLGAAFNGSSYSFHYDDGLLINTLQLKEFDDAEFQEFLADVKASYDTEQQRLEDERLQKIEDDRVAKELADAVTAQAEANKTAHDALAAKQTKLRIKELTMLGGIQIDADGYSIGGHTFIGNKSISEYTDEAWESLIEEIENYVAPEPEPIVIPSPPEPSNHWNLPDNEVASGNPVEQPQESYVTNDGGPVPVDETLPLSTFYLEEVNDFSANDIANEEVFKEWVAETLIDDVRENTPHGKCGDSENTLLFKWDGKFWEGHISNIEWNRHDKQFYFIDMYSAPKITLKEVRLPAGPKPILTANETLAFNLQKPFDDFNVSMKLKMRIYPDAYAEQAMAGVGAVGNSGKVQGLNWALIQK